MQLAVCNQVGVRTVGLSGSEAVSEALKSLCTLSFFGLPENSKASQNTLLGPGKVDVMGLPCHLVELDT